MSLKTAQKFLEMMSQNRVMQTQFRVADPPNLDKLLTFAHGKGFIITPEELDAALKDVPSNGIMNEIRARSKIRR